MEKTAICVLRYRIVRGIRMRNLIKMVFLFVLLCSICVSDVSLGNTSLLYGESFSSGKSLAALGFSGKEPTYWKLDSAKGYMISTAPDKKSPALIYSKTFSVTREQGPVTVEWAVNYLTAKPGKAWMENNKTWVSLADQDNKLLYTLLYKPHCKQDQWKDPDLELTKDGNRVIGSTTTKAITPTEAWVR